MYIEYYYHMNLLVTKADVKCHFPPYTTGVGQFWGLNFPSVDYDGDNDKTATSRTLDPNGRSEMVLAIRRFIIDNNKNDVSCIQCTTGGPLSICITQLRIPMHVHVQKLILHVIVCSVFRVTWQNSIQKRLVRLSKFTGKILSITSWVWLHWMDSASQLLRSP